MEIKALSESFTICKAVSIADIDFDDNFCFVGKTDDELSLVCSTARVPFRTIQRDDGWRGFRIQSVLDFSLVGILSRISSLLAGAGIGIFAISTYNTDYILVKEADFERALDIMRTNGYTVVGA